MYVLYILFTIFLLLKNIIYVVLWIPAAIIMKICYRARVEGRENIPKKGTILVAPNHGSYLDWWLVAVTMTRPVHFVMYAPFWFYGLLLFLGLAYLVPLWGWLGLLAYVGTTIPVIGKNDCPGFLKAYHENIIVAYNAVMAFLASFGLAIVMFVEGGITSQSKDMKLMAVKKGAGHFLRNNKATFVPLGFKNVFAGPFARTRDDKLFRAWFRFRPHITIRYGKPIAYQDYTEEAAAKAIKQLAEQFE